MGVTAQKIDPANIEELRWLEGPWRNDACLGYIVDAMERLNYDKHEIYTVLLSVKACFDDTTVEEAAKHWYDF